ncbi:MAG: hypothetical protein JAY74_29005, partial [Candidatus Thiodiazotropha taylori]|nr:hypothetical protein [Candidatus Thiodiazotropha taylori]
TAIIHNNMSQFGWGPFLGLKVDTDTMGSYSIPPQHKGGKSGIAFDLYSLLLSVSRKMHFCRRD